MTARVVAELFVVNVSWAEPAGRPGLIGPFLSRLAAEAWGHRHVDNGEWNVSPLASTETADAREVLTRAMRPFYGADYLDTVVDAAIDALARADLLWGRR